MARQTFRDRIGLRQDADSWIKSINNILGNLRSQGLEEYAVENIKRLQAYGFDVRVNNNGEIVISRGAANADLYYSLTEQTTKEIRNKDIFDVTKAKANKKWRDEREQEELEDEDEDELEDDDDIFEDDYIEEPEGLKNNAWELLYEAARWLLERYNELAENTAPIDLNQAMRAVYNEADGNPDDFNSAAQRILDRLKEFEAQFRDDYDDLYNDDEYWE